MQVSPPGLSADGSLDQTALATSPLAVDLFHTVNGTGRNVMVIHGWTCDAHDWSWQMPALEERHRVFAVDLRGHGRSPVPPSGNYQPADYVRDVEALIERYFKGGKFTLIGHSMGAQLSAILAAKRPDVIEAVVSVDGSLGFAAELEPIFQNAHDDLSAGDPTAVAAALFQLFYDDGTSPALKRWHARRVQGMPLHVVRESFGPLFLGPDQVGTGDRSEAFCRTLTIPVYHLCRDPAQAERMRAWFSHPASKVEAWDNAGHWIMLDRSEDVNAAILAWVDSLSERK